MSADPHEHLREAISAVDWAGSVAAFSTDTATLQALSSSSLRLAIWCHAIEGAEAGNPALPFVRSAQVEMQYVAALLALSLYRPAAASMRAMVEGVLYYSYYRCHPSELRSLLSPDSKFYVDKKEIVDWHKAHTPGFAVRSEVVGLHDSMNRWYSRVSAITHGQLPGIWASHSELAGVHPDAAIMTTAIAEYVAGVEVAHKFLLSTVEVAVWSRFQASERKAILKGLSKPDVQSVGLSVL